MNFRLDTPQLKHALSVNIQKEHDLVKGRQRARQVSALLGLSQQDQTRVATAVSEIARNAFQYAGGGRLDFLIDLQAQPQFLWVQVSDHGPGISNIDSVLAGTYVSPTGMGVGLAGSSRLMDDFRISSSPEGTVVRFGKAILKPITISEISAICSQLAQQSASSLAEELEQQNRDLLQTLDTLRTRESELERRQQELTRLNLELEETNRGVLALYAELDEKAEALRRADEMKSRFLSHVSHEFRTPVSSVLALTRLLLMRADGDLLREQEKQVSYIRDAAQQLADIVNDLLDLAKVESGKTEVRLTKIEVSQFLGATRALMRPLATNEAVSLIFEDPPFSIAFESDESKLGQILRNLISNSLKFTQQGEVRVTATLLSENTIAFAVKDTGIGIAPEDQDRIFQEFTQIEHPLQTRVKGTGLGLPLSRKLATLLGGSLAVESKPGAGSTFTLTLPYRHPIEAATTQKAGTPPCPRPKTILVVDDETTSRYLVERLLTGTKHHIIEASGSEAAERARFEAPDLILLDLMMPDRSGFEILDHLKSDPETASFPVIIHTAKVMNETDYERLGTRIVGVLPKGTDGRLPALMAIREILGEPDLFSSEPEFS